MLFFFLIFLLELRKILNDNDSFANGGNCSNCLGELTPYSGPGNAQYHLDNSCQNMSMMHPSLRMYYIL
jgi:hypothetical protein